MNITEQIENFVRLNGGSERDALNVALARLDAAEARAAQLEQERYELSSENITLKFQRDAALSERDRANAGFALMTKEYDKARSELSKFRKVTA